MSVCVECQPGFRGAPEPAEFRLGERRLVVRAIVDRWFAPARRWFKIEADDGDVYILHHDEATAAWELVAYTSAGRAAAAEPTAEPAAAPGPGMPGYLRSPRLSM